MHCIALRCIASHYTAMTILHSVHYITLNIALYGTTHLYLSWRAARVAHAHERIRARSTLLADAASPATALLKVPSWQRAITKPKDGTAPHYGTTGSPLRDQTGISPLWESASAYPLYGSRHPPLPIMGPRCRHIPIMGVGTTT